MQPSTLAKRGIVLLFLAVVAFYFYGLGQIPFVGPDEPRYAQVAREMFLRHDLITPTLGGRTWFEKPALLYWMMIASFKMFGVSEWAARLPAAISGLLTIAAVFVIGRRIEQERRENPPADAGGAGKLPPADAGGSDKLPPADAGSSDKLPPADAGGSDKNYKLQGFAFWSTLAAATTIGIVVFSRAASFDIILTMTTTWTLAFYILYELEPHEYELEPHEKRRRKLLAGCYVFIGLSLLAKGLIGIVIPVGVAGLYYLFQRRLPRRNTLFSVVWGVPLALVVAATWYAPVIARHGWPFIDQFFIQHHFARYVSDKYHHWRPAYYYLQVVPLLAAPWTGFFIDGLLQFKSRLWRAPVDDYADERWRNPPPAYPGGADKLPPAYAGGSDKLPPAYAGGSDKSLNRLLVFALAWFLFPFVFFSFSNSKLPGYILPVLPAVALIVGASLWRLCADPGGKGWPIRTTAAFGLLFAIGVLVYSWRTGSFPPAAAILVAAPLLFAGGFSFFFPGKRSAANLLLAGAIIVVLVVALHSAAPAAADLDSSKRLLELAAARGYSRTPIYGMQRSDRTPEFYAAGRVVYGPDGEPIMYEGPETVIAESRRRNDAVLAFVPLAELERLTALTGAQTDVIGNNGRYAIVAVRAK